MTLVFSHPYLPCFVVDAPDHIRASAMASEYIKVNKPQRDMKVADLFEYKVHILNNSVFSYQR